MSHKQQIKLNILTRKHWLFAVRVLLLLAIISASVNSQFAFAMALLVIVVKLEWIADRLSFFKVSESKLTLIIFPDGEVRLESNENTIEVFLGRQQWFTNHVAVIQVIDGGKARNLFVLSTQQENQQDFRRFNMWIRQDFYRDATGVQVSGK